MTNENRIIPVILSGGTGSRLWPMSREQFPKQLLPLVSSRSMIQDTSVRFGDSTHFLPPIVVTNESLRFSVADQLLTAGLPPQALLLEPIGRNTAPAVTAAALLAAEVDPQAVLFVVPSDHRIGDLDAFLALTELAASAARAGFLVTFSVKPTRPETGYGYIRTGAPLPGLDGIQAVAAFVEKPDAERAKTFVASGDYFWNSGMFMFTAARFLEEVGRYAPEILAAVREAVDARTTDQDFVRLEARAFAAAPSLSIDYAVMEKTDRAATLVGDFGWSDVGSWNELWAIGTKDMANNVLSGDIVLEDSHGCYIRSEGPLTAVLGVQDLVVVVTDDAVLISDRERSQEIKQVVDRLREQGRDELSAHTRVHRPWGYYQAIHRGERFQVKRLTVRPGAKLSLQKHYHRAEHWVVVNGTALVTCGETTQIVCENQSVYIPLGSLHRLENPGKFDLNLIEVQSGAYLGEDDIVRLDDTYSRQ